MNVNLRKIEGNWTLGYALDKHTLSSTFLGYNEYGRGQWDTTRSEAGQALFRLKYRDDYSQIEAIAQAIVNEIVAPYFPKIGFVVPMPASKKGTFSRLRSLLNGLRNYWESFVLKARC